MNPFCAIFHVLLWLSLAFNPSNLSKATAIPEPGCPTKCGSLTVPYPFGIGLGTNCSIGPWYDIICNITYDPPKAFISTGNLEVAQLEVLEISASKIRVKNFVSFTCYNDTGFIVTQNLVSMNLKGTPFTFSQENKFTVIGCDNNALLIEGAFEVTTGCISSCRNYGDVLDNFCTGIGCCQTAVPKGMQEFFASVSGNHTEVWSFNPCSYAFLGDQNMFTFLKSDLNDPTLVETINESVPLVIDWAIGNKSCADVQNSADNVCQHNSECIDVDNDDGGYRCKCVKGYQGNPYVSSGCLDINECDDNPCHHTQTCSNFPGGFNCTCPHRDTSDVQKSVDIACQQNSECIDSGNGFGGYKCNCINGYQGNPYFSPGCLDTNECDDSPCDSRGTCSNFGGGFNCTCPRGFIGDGKKDGKGCNREGSGFPVMKLSLGVSFGLLSFILSMVCLYYSVRQRKLIMLKKKFFHKNGGVLLKQKISSNGESSDSARIFTMEELKRATKNYSEDYILGKGGFGVVYKGILENQRVVAIKRSRQMEECEIESFINELVILLQVNHRNVVKLLGCCLETEVPQLVYEYVSNGTLLDHIEKSGEMTWFSFENRLRIAHEAATAFAYLHSSASPPIIHRDVKSANILLDEKYTAKISDFGASRLVPLDQTRLTTVVMGTRGYLDPEYFNTGKLTEKSDVFSFGVVLVELLTRRKPFSNVRVDRDGTLANYFIVSENEGSLDEILDPRIHREASFKEINIVVELAKRCLKLEGEERPTMKNVVIELERVKKLMLNGVS